MARRRPSSTAKRSPEIRYPEEGWRWVTDTWPEDPEAEGLNPWFEFLRPEEEEVYWREFGPRVMKRWPRERPGTRPRLWWLFDAPALRERLGGTGAAPSPDYRPPKFGVPPSWSGVDRSDPPVFESEAAYLKRLDLLLPGELERLTDIDFAPVVVRVSEFGSYEGFYPPPEQEPAQ